MEGFVFHLPTRVVFGSGKLAEAGVEAKRLGKRPILLTGRSAMRKSGILDRVTGLLKASGVDPLVFEKIEPNPRLETLEEAQRLYESEGCDFVMALGGGSPMDAAKALAVAVGHSQPGKPASIWDFTNGALGGRRRVEKMAPCLLISTTAATGSEGNCAAVITKWATKEKAVLWDLKAFPSTSIVDPELMLGLPMENTRDGAVDMMLHVLEQTFNGDDKAGFLDRTVEGMVRGMMEGLDQVEQDPKDLTARENLAWASVFALIAGGGPNWGRNGSFTVHHLEHALSGHTDVSHGHGLAALWPRYLPVIMEKREAKIARMGEAIFGVPAGPSAGPKTVDALEAWLKRHQLWFHLKDFGVTEAMIPVLASDSIRLNGGGRPFLNAPLPLNQERCEAIYRAAF